MLPINKLIKLYTRGHFNKLLHEGIIFLKANKDKLPHNIVGQTVLEQGYITKIEVDFRKFEVIITEKFKNHFDTNADTITRIPLEEYKFNGLRNITITTFSQLIGELIFLLLPKEDLTITLILHCKNSTVQSRLINIYGDKEFFKALNATVIHKDGENELLRINLGYRSELMMVKVVDTTTKQIHLLRVPSTVELKPATNGSRAIMIPMRTCKQAIAWTFGMKTAEYHPDGES